MSTPKKHHYVPAFYLRRFAGRRDDILHVFDRVTGAQRISAPRSEAYEKHFNRIQLTGVDPNAFEYALAEMESEAAPIIDRVITQQRMPDGPRRDVLLRYIAFQVLRTKAYRSTLEQHRRDPERRPWESSAEHEARLAMDKSAFRARVIRESIEGTLVVQGALVDRHWTVWLAPDGGPEFVTSDTPVAALAELDGTMTPTGPGALLLTRGWAVFPLSPRVALIGRYEESDKLFARVLPLDVALVNTAIGRSAYRFIWSRRPRFHFAYADGIRNDVTLFRYAGVRETDD